MKEKIYAILNEISPGVDFRTKEDFFDDGFRDSMEFIGFMTRLNEEFDIEIDGMDIVPENFANIDAIVALLAKYGVG